ncbi:MAG: hypothetical protein MJE77_10105 [Proteobacteria bacterium]|nr:hypothetical protein [Pseudomonadota bacterium]
MSEQFDPRQRELCPDGACIGLIGPGGRCKECGLPATMAVLDVQGVGEVVGKDESEKPMARVSGFDRSERELCPDGSCVGLIGSDGRCKECGTTSPNAGLDPRRRGLRSDEEVAEELEANIAKSDLCAAPEQFDRRELCPDGSCIGVIGPNGRCKECGTALS